MPRLAALFMLILLALPATAEAHRSRLLAKTSKPLPDGLVYAGERVPTPDPGAPRILFIGDSNFFGPLGLALQRDYMRLGYHVMLRGKPASGLANPEFFDWFAEAGRLIDEFRPDIVVCLLGGNDTQRLSWPYLPGKRIRFADEVAWRRGYEGRYRAFARFLSERVAKVYLLSPTNRGWDRARVAVTRVREVQQVAVRGLGNVTWIDMFPHSSNADGTWLREGMDDHGKRVVFRRPDRVHLTPEGGRLVGQRVFANLRRLGV